MKTGCLRKKNKLTHKKNQLTQIECLSYVSKDINPNGVNGV
jgi:hypothetical protein